MTKKQRIKYELDKRISEEAEEKIRDILIDEGVKSAIDMDFVENNEQKLKEDEAYCPYCKSIFKREDGHNCWEGRMSDGSEFMENENEQKKQGTKEKKDVRKVQESNKA